MAERLRHPVDRHNTFLEELLELGSFRNAELRARITVVALSWLDSTAGRALSAPVALGLGETLLRAGHPPVTEVRALFRALLSHIGALRRVAGAHETAPGELAERLRRVLPNG